MIAYLECTFAIYWLFLRYFKVRHNAVPLFKNSISWKNGLNNLKLLSSTCLCSEVTNSRKPGKLHSYSPWGSKNLFSKRKDGVRRKKSEGIDRHKITLYKNFTLEQTALAHDRAREEPARRQRPHQDILLPHQEIQNSSFRLRGMPETSVHIQACLQRHQSLGSYLSLSPPSPKSLFGFLLLWRQRPERGHGAGESVNTLLHLHGSWTQPVWSSGRPHSVKRASDSLEGWKRRLTSTIYRNPLNTCTAVRHGTITTFSLRSSQITGYSAPHTHHSSSATVYLQYVPSLLTECAISCQSE